MSALTETLHSAVRRIAVQEAVVDLFARHVRIGERVESFERLDLVLQRDALQRLAFDGHAVVAHAFQYAYGCVRPQLLGDGIDDRDVEQVVAFREKMVAGLSEVIARGGTPRAAAFIAAGHARLDPSFALELQELLPHRLARELQLIGELRDRRWALALECEKDGAAAVGKLVYGDDGLAPEKCGNETVESNTPIVKRLLANVYLG